MDTSFKFMATGIGSMPFNDVDYAVNLSLKYFPEAPFWPQLPKLGFFEEMVVQYSEGMPAVIIDEKNNRMYFDTNGDNIEELTLFYENYLLTTDSESKMKDLSCMAISQNFSKGIYAFEKKLILENKIKPFIKVQTTGPCSFSLTAVDENRRAIYYNKEFRDVIVKALSMKCRWQIQKFQPYAEKIICFIDEPILSAFGSSTYVGVQRHDVVELLKEVVDAIHEENALAGVHCCGNTEWSILVDAGVDIINFDSFEYGETIALYGSDIKTFLKKGGWLAWGAIPTSGAINEYTIEGLISLLKKMIENLAGKNIDKQLIINHSLISPSCGTGFIKPSDAEKVFEATSFISSAMRELF